MMNLDEIFLLPDLCLSQTIEQIEQQINEWKEKQFKNIEMVYNKSIKKTSFILSKIIR
jgi:hypothetical protein